jgi:hypothetical protein
MAAPDKGSLAGRGPQELLPERGNPFALDAAEPRDLSAEDLAALYRAGIEFGGQGAGGDPADQPPAATAPEPIAHQAWMNTLEALPPAVLPPASPGDPGRLAARLERLRSAVHESIDDPDRASAFLTNLETAAQDLQGVPDERARALRALDRVELRLRGESRLRSWASTTGLQLLAAQMLIGVLLLAGLVALLGGGEASARSDAVRAMTAGLWGGVGGVIAALLALRRALGAPRRPARLEPLWSLSHPVIGLLLGAAIFVVARALESLLAPTVGWGTWWPAYALAALAGALQNLLNLAGSWLGREETAGGI